MTKISIIFCIVSIALAMPDPKLHKKHPDYELNEMDLENSSQSETEIEAARQVKMMPIGPVGYHPIIHALYAQQIANQVAMANNNTNTNSSAVMPSGVMPAPMMMPAHMPVMYNPLQFLSFQNAALFNNNTIPKDNVPTVQAPVTVNSDK